MKRPRPERGSWEAHCIASSPAVETPIISNMSQLRTHGTTGPDTWGTRSTPARVRMGPTSSTAGSASMDPFSPSSKGTSGPKRTSSGHVVSVDGTSASGYAAHALGAGKGGERGCVSIGAAGVASSSDPSKRKTGEEDRPAGAAGGGGDGDAVFENRREVPPCPLGYAISGTGGARGGRGGARACILCSNSATLSARGSGLENDPGFDSEGKESPPRENASSDFGSASAVQAGGVEVEPET